MVGLEGSQRISVDVQCLWLAPGQTKDLRTGGRCFDAQGFDALAGINGGAIGLCLAAECEAAHNLMWNVAHILVPSCMLHSCAPHFSEEEHQVCTASSDNNNNIIRWHLNMSIVVRSTGFVVELANKTFPQLESTCENRGCATQA